MAKSKKKQYVFAEGRRLPVPAQTAGEELDRIEARDGGITPKAVVEESRPEDAPLHPCFEWDNEVAAELYREDQARNIIRTVRVVRVDSAGESTPKVAYVSTSMINGDDSTSRFYINTARAMSNEMLREQVLADCLTQLRGLVNRFRDLSEMAGLFDRIQLFIEELESQEAAGSRR